MITITFVIQNSFFYKNIHQNKCKKREIVMGTKVSSKPESTMKNYVSNPEDFIFSDCSDNSYTLARNCRRKETKKRKF